MLRIDKEKPGNCRKGLEKLVFKFIDEKINNWDAIIFSDYNKGFVSSNLAKKVIEIAERKKIPVVVDTKNKNIAHYEGATVITPNAKEALAITNIEKAEIAGKIIAKRYKIKNVLITKGSQGMTLCYGNKIINISVFSKEVYDVTGAGDTVVSVLAISLSSGFSLVEAAYISNVAAGIVVGKVGTSTVSLKELQDNLLKL